MFFFKEVDKSKKSTGAAKGDDPKTKPNNKNTMDQDNKLVRCPAFYNIDEFYKKHGIDPITPKDNPERKGIAN